jgi:hypothetical protein
MNWPEVNREIESLCEIILTIEELTKIVVKTETARTRKRILLNLLDKSSERYEKITRLLTTARLSKKEICS